MERFKITDSIFLKNRLVIEAYDETGRYAYVTEPSGSYWQQEDPDGVYRTIQDQDLVKECNLKFSRAVMDPELTKGITKR